MSWLGLEHFHGRIPARSQEARPGIRNMARGLRKRDWAQLRFWRKCSGESRFSGRRTAIETEEETAAGKLLDRLRPDVLNGLAGDVEGNESDDLNGLMRRDAKRAVRVDMTGRMAVRHLHHPNHQNQRDADDPEQRNPGRARA